MSESRVRENRTHGSTGGRWRSRRRERGLLVPGRCAQTRHHDGLVGTSTVHVDPSSQRPTSPIYCFADATGETLGVLLRPGNAGANTIADHVTVLDQAIRQLPAEIAVGHRAGDDPGLVRRPVRVRCDSAGCTDFVWQARRRNVGFSVVARSNANVHAAISRVIVEDDRWRPAILQNGDVRKGAAVAELTDLVDLSGWPDGTRLIVRREPLHPGAQQTLFPSLHYRYWGHYTDAAGDAVDLDVDMRAHAHVEDHIRRLKDSGANRFPFVDIDANRAWLAVVCFADTLVRWFQLLCLTGSLAVAEPKTLRWSLWHTPARIVRHARRHIVRILDGWPTADELFTAYRRVALIT
jgi:hypothetical protein